MNWSARGGETAGEVEGGGGEERGELLWVACNNISFFITFFMAFCVFKAFNLEEKAAESLSIRLSDQTTLKDILLEKHAVYESYNLLGCINICNSNNSNNSINNNNKYNNNNTSTNDNNNKNTSCPPARLKWGAP